MASSHPDPSPPSFDGSVGTQGRNAASSRKIGFPSCDALTCATHTVRIDLPETNDVVFNRRGTSPPRMK
jgi:hypothetical protein